MTVTGHEEHVLTEEALERLTRWGRNPNSDGGENIAFSVSRQGAPSDAFLATGDCTPFTPQGHRGILNGQPVADTGAPVTYFIDFGIPLSVNQVPCTFAIDLNTGKVTMTGAFPSLPSTLDFTVEFDKRFQDDDGYNVLFHSGKTSDDAGYVIAFQHVAATG
jgi:hypothetical protein